jgi:hypothetical protein
VKSTTTTTREHINAIMLQTIGREYIQNMYKLLSIEPMIRYLHVAVGFPVEETWLKVVQQGNCNSWPLINITNVTRYIPESEETHVKGTHAWSTTGHSKRNHLMYFLMLPPHPHMKARKIYLSESTDLERQ